MQNAGGVVALIGGVFGFIAAVITLLIGGIGGAAGAANANTVVGLGWGGVLFSFLVIVFGAISMGAKTKKPGIMVILSSVCGVILGGTLVAVCLSLSFVGGMLAMIGIKKITTSDNVTS